MMLCSALNCTKTSTNTAVIIASEVVVFIDFWDLFICAKDLPVSGQAATVTVQFDLLFVDRARRFDTLR